MNNKKKTIKVIFCIAVVLLMFFILYRMFRDSYEDIVDSLSKTNMYIFAGMVLLGNCYYLIDAVVYYGITVRQGIKIKFSKFIPIAYMSIFLMLHHLVQVLNLLRFCFSIRMVSIPEQPVA